MYWITLPWCPNPRKLKFERKCYDKIFKLFEKAWKCLCHLVESLWNISSQHKPLVVLHAPSDYYSWGSHRVLEFIRKYGLHRSTYSLNFYEPTLGISERSGLTHCIAYCSDSRFLFGITQEEPDSHASYIDYVHASFNNYAISSRIYSMGFSMLMI